MALSLCLSHPGIPVGGTRLVQVRGERPGLAAAPRRLVLDGSKLAHQKLVNFVKGDLGSVLQWGRKRQVEVVKVRRKTWLVCLTSIVLLVCSPVVPAWSLTDENLLFLEAWRTVDRAYVDKSFNGQSWFRYRENALHNEPMNTRVETYAAIRKMLATLGDPFTRFLEPEKFKSLRSGTTGALTGVGLEVGFDISSNGSPEDLVVVTALEGAPAARAGISPGDVILKIDGEKIEGLNLYEAAGKLQGPANSSVELTLLNKDSKLQRTVLLTREKITVNPVSWRICESVSSSKLGYIRLSTFNRNSVSAVKEAIQSLKEDGASAYVLDIRNNGGGYFPAVIDIAKMWLDKGVIVYIADSRGIRDLYEADGQNTIASTEPLLVLVNKGTASASEILAGALKDNKRGVILGEQTFGKGKIQSIFELSDGSAIAVTTARYQTPAQVDIDKVGITPDHQTPTLPRDGDGFCKCIEKHDECSISLSTLLSRS